MVRDGDRVRLFSRNGHDWSGRFPRIGESALRNRHEQFVVDGEAVLLGIDPRVAQELVKDPLMRYVAIHNREGGSRSQPRRGPGEG